MPKAYQTVEFLHLD